MAVAQQRTSANLIRALYNLSREHDTQKRQHLLNAGLVEMINWFSLVARKIVEGKMKLPKQTQKFIDRHKDDVKKIASAMVDPEIKRSIILKSGGGGLFGGTIFEVSLDRMEINELMRKFGKKKDQLRNHLRKPSKKSKQVSKKSKTYKKTAKKTAQKRKINERFIIFRKRTPPWKQFTPPSTPSLLSSLPSPPSSIRSLVNSILQDMYKTPQKTSLCNPCQAG